MNQYLAENILRYGFKRLLLAVSGGVDSICLAHYFISNKDALGIEWLGIAHIHHGLREGTADRDAKFVEEFANQYKIPFFLKRLNGEALKEAEGSLEENARDARYKALVDVALEALRGDRVHGSYRSHSSLQDDALHTPYLKAAEGCDPIPHTSIAIVTAHHAGDQAETMYMRLRRGTTLEGLRGIQEIRVLGNSQGVAGLASEAPLEGVMEDRATGCNQGDTSPLIINHPSSIINHQSKFIYRPFLSITREELLGYAREKGLDWCEDESNVDVMFARNKIRHELLPSLENSCTGAAAQLCRVASLADNAYRKVMEVNEHVFTGALSEETPTIPDATKTFALDKKKLREILTAHADTDLSELFRLWLSAKGFRFPIEFFYDQEEPAHVKIPVRAAYRKRSIAKIDHTICFCEFEDAEAALKFVSCG